MTDVLPLLKRYNESAPRYTSYPPATKLARGASRPTDFGIATIDGVAV